MGRFLRLLVLIGLTGCAGWEIGDNWNLKYYGCKVKGDKEHGAYVAQVKCRT